MSDTVFEARPPTSLAWLKTRLVSRFGSEADALRTYGVEHRVETPIHGTLGNRRGLRLAPRRPERLSDLTLATTFAEPFSTSAGDREFARRFVDLARPLASLGKRFARPLALSAVGLVLIAGSGALVGTAWRNLSAATPAAPAPIQAWREIIKPVRIYSLEAPDFAGAPVTYLARRHTSGGGREDVLALGTLDGDRPAIRLRIFRRGDEASAQTPLFATLAHEAAQAGLSIARSGLPDLLPTRFGRFEVADVSLARKDGPAAPCAGFRLALDRPALSIAGLSCGRRAVPLTRLAIGCLIERLDVASARDDHDLIDFFARSELRRNAACAGMRLGPDGLHAPWLDDKTGEKIGAAAPAKPVTYGEKPSSIRKRLRRR